LQQLKEGVMVALRTETPAEELKKAELEEALIALLLVGMVK
jgi:hypothetical protein